MMGRMNVLRYRGVRRWRLRVSVRRKGLQFSEVEILQVTQCQRVSQEIILTGLPDNGEARCENVTQDVNRRLWHPYNCTD
jgi:hypothetical protein